MPLKGCDGALHDSRALMIPCVVKNPPTMIAASQKMCSAFSHAFPHTAAIHTNLLLLFAFYVKIQIQSTLILSP